MKKQILVLAATALLASCSGTPSSSDTSATQSASGFSSGSASDSSVDSSTSDENVPMEVIEVVKKSVANMAEETSYGLDLYATCEAAAKGVIPVDQDNDYNLDTKVGLEIGLDARFQTLDEGVKGFAGLDVAIDASKVPLPITITELDDETGEVVDEHHEIKEYDFTGPVKVDAFLDQDVVYADLSGSWGTIGKVVDLLNEHKDWTGLSFDIPSLPEELKKISYTFDEGTTGIISYGPAFLAAYLGDFLTSVDAETIDAIVETGMVSFAKLEGGDVEIGADVSLVAWPLLAGYVTSELANMGVTVDFYDMVTMTDTKATAKAVFSEDAPKTISVELAFAGSVEIDDTHSVEFSAAASADMTLLFGDYVRVPTLENKEDFMDITALIKALFPSEEKQPEGGDLE